MSAFRRTPDVTSPALQRLLDDAAAPGRHEELTGLGAALTAFGQAPAPRRAPVRSALAAVLAAKALAPVAAAAAVGGVALAAATGTLPGTANQDPTPASSGRHASASPSPSQVGLCRAYLAGVRNAKGKALDNPAFATLVAAAGSAEKVDAYCATVLADAPGGRPTEKPGKAGDHPTGKPADVPRGKASGKPATVPPAQPEGLRASVPPAHPTGSPVSVPVQPKGPPATVPVGH